MQNTVKPMRICVCLTSIFIILALACACQPTPEKTAVVYRDFEEKLKEASAPAGIYDAPSQWQETLNMKGSDAQIAFDATISIPDVTAFPVYKVKPTVFDDARIQSMVRYFTKGRDVYEVPEATKAELKVELIAARKDNDQEWAAELETMIAAAPENVEAKIIPDWSADQSKSGIFLDEGGEYAGISISADSILYSKGDIFTNSILYWNDMAMIKEVSISEESAIAAADNMLRELGIDHMVADSLEKAQRYARLSDNAYAQYSKEPVSKGYLIQYARNVDGIHGITDNGASMSYYDEFEYQAPLYPEEIWVYVDEAGIVQAFSWFYPLKVVATMAKNANLLPFEEVQQRIRDMLTFINSYDGYSIKVTGLEIRMALADVKDHSDEAMYVPAWFIDYTIITEHDLIERTLALNAIDGGRLLEMPMNAGSDVQKAMDEARLDYLKNQ